MRVIRLCDFDSSCTVRDLGLFFKERPAGQIGHKNDLPRETNIFVYLFEGAIDFTAPDGVRRLESGKLFYIPCGIRCGSVFREPVNRLLLLRFSLEQNGEPCILHTGPTMISPPPEACPILEEMRLCPPTSHLRVCELFYRLLSVLNAAGFPDAASEGSAAVMAGYRRMVAHLTENLTVGELAEAAGLSEGHFRRLFSRAFGMSPVSYRNLLRVRYAAELTRDGLYTAEAAAEAAGLGSAAYLWRLKKRFML